MCYRGKGCESPSTTITSLTAIALSMMGSVFIGVVCLRLPMQKRKKLFAKLMLQLAVADLVIGMSEVPVILIEFGSAINPTSIPMGDASCMGIMTTFFSFRNVSTIIETMIALGFPLMHFRCMRSLHFLDKFCYLAWPLGITIGCLMNVSHSIYFDHSAGRCLIMEGIGDGLAAGLYMVVFTVSIIAYAVTLCAACKDSPSSAIQRVLNRNMLYPVNFVVTYGMSAYVEIFPDSIDMHTVTSQTIMRIALTAESLNGFFNAITYIWIVYGPRSSVRNATCESQLAPREQDDDSIFGIASFHVKFSAASFKNVNTQSQQECISWTAKDEASPSVAV